MQHQLAFNIDTQCLFTVDYLHQKIKIQLVRRLWLQNKLPLCLSYMFAYIVTVTTPKIPLHLYYKNDHANQNQSDRESIYLTITLIKIGWMDRDVRTTQIIVTRSHITT